MKLIQLTTVKGEKVYINPEHVTHFRQAKKGTVICFHAAGDYYPLMQVEVSQDVDQVAALFSDL